MIPASAAHHPAVAKTSPFFLTIRLQPSRLRIVLRLRAADGGFQSH